VGRRARLSSAPSAANARARSMRWFLELLHPLGPAELTENAQRVPEAARSAPAAGELDLLLRERDRLVAPAEQRQRLGLQPDSTREPRRR
jgi:hypothetical protein